MATVGLGLTCEGSGADMDALEALEGALGGAQFWNPHTLAGLSRDFVDAYTDYALRRNGVSPALEREARWTRKELSPEAALLVLRGMQQAWDPSVHRPLAYVAGLPLELVKAPVNGGAYCLDRTITWLPALTLKGGLNLYGCQAIAEIPSGLSLAEGLNLEKSSVSVLGEHISVGKLNLVSSKVTSLPTGLSVKLGLTLIGQQIHDLPADLEVGREGWLSIYVTPLLRHSDEEIRQMAPKMRGEIWRR
jgi:hypothetical protein